MVKVANIEGYGSNSNEDLSRVTNVLRTPPKNSKKASGAVKMLPSAAECSQMVLQQQPFIRHRYKHG